MKQRELITKLSKGLGIQKVQAGKLYDWFLDMIEECLLAWEVVNFRRLFTLEIWHQKPRNIVHKHTGKVVQDKKFKVLKCRTSRVFKGKLKK